MITHDRTRLIALLSVMKAKEYKEVTDQMKATHRYLAWIAVCALALSGCSASTGSSEAETQKTSVADVEGDLNIVKLTDDGQISALTASEYVTLPDYKEATLSASTLEVTDEQLQSEIDDLLADYAEENQVTDREVADGDKVNIDYVGHLETADGEEFDGGSTYGNGTDVTIGKTNYIDDFLEQLIGHKPGETINVEVTFPTPYENNTELSGKDAVFVTTINYITESVTPELTDDFVTENLADSGYTSAEDVRTKLTESLEKEHQFDAVWEYLEENCTISSVPETLTDSLIDTCISYLQMMVSNYGSYYGYSSFDDYLSDCGYDSEDDLREAYRETMEESAKECLIAQAISDAENLEVTDEDWTESFGEDTLDEYKEFYGEDYVNMLKMQIRISKVADLIMETAKSE